MVSLPASMSVGMSRTLFRHEQRARKSGRADSADPAEQG